MCGGHGAGHLTSNPEQGKWGCCLQGLSLHCAAAHFISSLSSPFHFQLTGKAKKEKESLVLHVGSTLCCQK